MYIYIYIYLYIYIAYVSDNKIQYSEINHYIEKRMHKCRSAWHSNEGYKYG